MNCRQLTRALLEHMGTVRVPDVHDRAFSRVTSPFWSKPIGPSTVSNRRLCPLPSQPAPAAKSGRVQPSSSSSALASLRSAVSKPSVNQP